MSEPNGLATSQGKTQFQLNGLISSNSSRGTSPVPKTSQIPQSQLPPTRTNIPSSQLPPSRHGIQNLTQKVGQLTVSGQQTPNLSPSKIASSTPTLQGQHNTIFSEKASPIVPNQLESVPLMKEDTKTNVDVEHRNIGATNVNQTRQYFNQSPAFNGFNAPIQPNVPSSTQSSSSSTTTFPGINPVPFNANNNMQKNFPSHISQPGRTNDETPSRISASSQINHTNKTISHSNLNLPYGMTQQNSLAFTNPVQNQPPASSIPFSENTNLQFASNIQPPYQPISKSQPISQINALAPKPSQISNITQQPQYPSTRPPQNVSSSYSTNAIPAKKSNYPQYPQNLPPPGNLKPTVAAPLNQGFNTGLPPRSVPYQAPLTAAPLPSQRFNPQINYNAGSAPNLNGPSTTNLPPPMQNHQAQQPPPMMGKRYPTPLTQGPNNAAPISSHFGLEPSGQRLGGGGVLQTGFNPLWGAESIDLLQTPNILPTNKIKPAMINLGQEELNQINCSTEVFRCTVTKIPETASLLQKSRLPLGLLIHPFKDLNYLPVIQCNAIVRCRSCRTYINPFVYFVDSKRWKCNLCFRVNDLPEEFQYDPVSKTYGDPSRRPEIKSSTIEYIAPSEYMLRPPQPAVYLYLLDVSKLAIESGYLNVFCAVLLKEIKNIPGDARTLIGILAYDSALHFFSLAEGLNQPHEMTVLDIEDIFLPTPETLLVNLKDKMELVEDLLRLLPKRFNHSFDGNSALGAALQVAHKMMGATGGRVSVFQASIPNVGPGAVTSREDPSQRSTVETPLLNPVNDFYKRLALECSGQQIAVDLFLLNSQYVDLATISGISRFSGGSIHHFPLFKANRPLLIDGFQKTLKRYLIRKIGFEAVMRVRCTRGLTVNTFHGNLFVRSMDLLSLPNINPDAGFGMQVAIEENMSESQTVCFQAALLYTSSKGERRIRVHTLCLPVASTLHDILQSADQQCIIGLLGKMGVDRSMQSSLSDAREAFINVAVDVLTAFKFSLNMVNPSSGLLAPGCLKLLPLYIAAILKQTAFRIGTPTRIDDRLKAMIDMKTRPLQFLMQQIYPDLYPIHNLESEEVVIIDEEEEPVPVPPRLQLSARCLHNKGAFLMDCGDHMMILVGPNVSQEFLNGTLGVADYNAIGDDMIEIPSVDELQNRQLHQFINYLNDQKSYSATLQVIRDNSPQRSLFLEKLIEDRLENSMSYHEFLQHLKTQVK